jgi:hypothetical protein
MTSVEKSIPEIIKIKKSDIGFVNYKPEKIPDYDKIINTVGTTALKSSEISKRKKTFNKTANLLQKVIEVFKDIVNTEMTFVNDYFDYNPNDSKHRKLFNKLKKLYKNQVKCDNQNKTVITAGLFSSTFEIDEIKNITDVLKHITTAIDNCFKILNDLATEHAKSGTYSSNISKDSGKTGDILKDSGLSEAQSKQSYPTDSQQSQSTLTGTQPLSTTTPTTPTTSARSGIYYGGFNKKTKRHNSHTKKLNRIKTMKSNKEK